MSMLIKYKSEFYILQTYRIYIKESSCQKAKLKEEEELIVIKCDIQQGEKYGNMISCRFSDLFKSTTEPLENFLSPF